MQPMPEDWERADHELQPRLVAQCGRRPQRPPQPARHGLPRAAKPVLAVEVIDRDKTVRAIPVGQQPVMAAPAHGQVLQRTGAQSPALRQHRRQAFG